jgi:4-amino-4-deoxy-L-arabinose transferase-like glycosyltransferase
MKFFGPTDLVARFYFMLCSFFSYLLVFKIGSLIKDKAFGYCALFTLALCFFYGKWSGGIKHDVPLTTAYLGFTYFFLRGLVRPRLFYFCAFFIAWGVFSKGPVIMGAPAAVFAWLLLNARWSFLKQSHFWGTVALTTALLALPFLPALHFMGENYYSLYYRMKHNYLELESGDPEYLFYFGSLIKGQAHVFVLFLISLYLYVKGALFQDRESRRLLGLCLLLTLAVLIPFSFFKFKLAYYILPAFPFYALFSAQALYALWLKHSWDWSKFLGRLSLAVMMIMLTFPIKTTGGRPKTNLNLINILKFDDGIRNKPVAFLGDYDTDMSIFQEYKFYGNIDLIPLDQEKMESFLDEGKGYAVFPLPRLPFKTSRHSYDRDRCFLYNDVYCVISLEPSSRFRLPVKQWPYEVYPDARR